MQLHARASRIGEDGIHPFAFESFDQDFAAQHGAAKLSPLGGGSGCGLRRFSYVAHNSLFCWLAVVAEKNPQPFPAVGSRRKSRYSRQAPTASFSTTTTTLRTACRIKSIIGEKASRFGPRSQ